MKLCHVTISVKDMEESLRFYRDTLGLSVKRRFPAGPGSEIAFLEGGGAEIELIYNQGRTDISIGQDISLGFEVASVSETLESLRQKGVATGEVASPSPQVRFFFVSDPNGLKVQLVEYVK